MSQDGLSEYRLFDTFRIARSLKTFRNTEYSGQFQRSEQII